MKFGVQNFSTDEGIRPDVFGSALEKRGFESLFFAEHSHIPVRRTTPYGRGGELPRDYYRSLDPFVALAAAATATSTLLLGTSVALLPQRDVLHTAKECASLDLVSGGRLVLGVGIGWNREEMEDHGVDPRTRGRLVDEQLAALREIWTNDEAEFHGDFVDFDPVFMWPKPVQKPHPPIRIGGYGEAAVARAVRFGAGWMPLAVADPRKVPEQLALINGRPVPITITGMPADDAGLLAAYLEAEAEIERIVFIVPTAPASRVLTELDALARLLDAYR